MRRCNLRILSLISGWIHALGCVLGFIGCLYVISNSEPDFGHKEWTDSQIFNFKNTLIFACVVCVIGFATSVILIVSIHQSRHNLMSVYMYMTYAGILLGFIATFGQFVKQLVDKEEVGQVFLNLLYSLLAIALEVVLFLPIYKLYQILRSEAALLDDESIKKPVIFKNISKSVQNVKNSICRKCKTNK